MFNSTCGGMGLTGYIIDVEIQLKPINSIYINQKTIKTKNLKETFEVFETIKNEPYSVAWIDCLSKGDITGRSLIMCGDFDDDGNLNYSPKKRFFWIIWVIKAGEGLFYFLFFILIFYGAYKLICPGFIDKRG